MRTSENHAQGPGSRRVGKMHSLATKKPKGTLSRHLGKATPQVAEKPPWSVWAIFFADNDLAEDAKEDLRSVKVMGVPAGVFLAAESDAIREVDCHWLRSTMKNLPEGMEYVPYPEECLGQRNYANAISEFMKWARKKEPGGANRKIVVIRGHGQGLGLESDDNRELSLGKIRGQIEKDIPISILAFDSCLMGSIEAAYEFSDVAEVLMASQVQEPAVGWPYSDMLRSIDSSQQNPETVAKGLVDAYREHFDAAEQARTSQAALWLNSKGKGKDAKEVAKLAGKLREMGKEAEGAANLAGKLGGKGKEAETVAKLAGMLGGLLKPKMARTNRIGAVVRKLRGDITSFGNGAFVDIVDFCEHLESSLSGMTEANAIIAVAGALKDAVHASLIPFSCTCGCGNCAMERECPACDARLKPGPDLTAACGKPYVSGASRHVRNAHGLSIWFPATQKAYEGYKGANKLWYGETRFGGDKDCGDWNQFLCAYAEISAPQSVKPPASESV